MFLSEEEAAARISSSENLLNRANRNTSVPLTDDDVPGALPVVEEETPVADSLVVDLLPAPACIVPEREIEKRIRRLLLGNARGIGALSPEVRASIGAIANILSPRQAGEMFAVEPESAGNLSRGLEADGRKASDDRLAKVHDIQSKVVDAAFSRLMKTLDLLDDDKLSEIEKATELAQVAERFSKIMASATPKEKSVEGGTVFHIYRPEMVTEQHYETVVVGEPRA